MAYVDAGNDAAVVNFFIQSTRCALKHFFLLTMPSSQYSSARRTNILIERVSFTDDTPVLKVAFCVVLISTGRSFTYTVSDGRDSAKAGTVYLVSGGGLLEAAEFDFGVGLWKVSRPAHISTNTFNPHTLNRDGIPPPLVRLLD